MIVISANGEIRNFDDVLSKQVKPILAESVRHSVDISFTVAINAISEY